MFVCVRVCVCVCVCMHVCVCVCVFSPMLAWYLAELGFMSIEPSIRTPLPPAYMSNNKDVQCKDHVQEI